MSLHIQIKNFEGPLALLLYLIQREEMNIFDIPIHRITEEYLNSLKVIRELNLDGAGEFIAMAATLIHIKSKMLLPREEREAEEVEDPREELVHKLLEYKKYKKASEKIYQRPLLGRDVWLRGEKSDLLSSTEKEEERKNVAVNEENLFILPSLYKKLNLNKKKQVHHVDVELQTVTSRILEMKEEFTIGKKIFFHDLLLKKKSSYPLDLLLVTFLSILELVRMEFISFFQNQNFGDIYITTKKRIRENLVQEMENNLNPINPPL